MTEDLSSEESSTAATRTPVALAELYDAYEYGSADGGEYGAYLDPRSGRIFYTSPNFTDEDAPEDLETSDVYIAIPDKFDLDLGRPVVNAFVDQELPDDWDRVVDIFRRKGAYGRFKQLLHDRNALERWYAFEMATTEKALRDWCEENEIPLKAADTVGQ